MPACGDGLQHEAWLFEVFWVLAFPELVGSKAVAIRGKGLYDRFKCVGRVEPSLGVEVLLHSVDLGVNTLRYEEVRTVPEVFYEALSRVSQEQFQRIRADADMIV